MERLETDFEPGERVMAYDSASAPVAVMRKSNTELSDADLNVLAELVVKAVARLEDVNDMLFDELEPVFLVGSENGMLFNDNLKYEDEEEEITENIRGAVREALEAIGLARFFYYDAWWSIGTP